MENDPAKNPKGSRGPLNSEDCERAKKEKLCFKCLSSEHEKKDCPKLRGKEPKKGSGRAVHTVQVLPLEASFKFFKLKFVTLMPLMSVV